MTEEERIALGYTASQRPIYLSPREREVLCRIADGDSYPECGRAIHISPETVKSHVRNILAKLEARNRTHAVVIAIRKGILK